MHFLHREAQELFKIQLRNDRFGGSDIGCFSPRRSNSACRSSRSITDAARARYCQTSWSGVSLDCVSREHLKGHSIIRIHRGRTRKCTTVFFAAV